MSTPVKSCQLIKTAQQTLTSGVWTAQVWGTVLNDDGVGFSAPGTDIPIPAGVTEMRFAMSFSDESSNSLGSRYKVLEEQTSGSVVVCRHAGDHRAALFYGAGTFATPGWVPISNAGSGKLIVFAQQDSGTSRGLNYGAVDTTGFSGSWGHTVCQFDFR